MTDARSGTTGLSGPAPILAGLAIMTSMALAACAGDAPMEAEPATPVPIMSMEAPSDPEAIRPFTIDVPEEVLVDLQNRLARARLPDQIPGAGWDYGTDRAYLEELLAYWQDGFDWRAQEQVLNRFDHFKTVIDGVDVHFIHQRSPNEDATPLLLTHGWPGSFTEFTQLIGPLTDPAAHGGDAGDAFHVVVPSIPGFGFSGKPTERGYNPERMADILAGLMERLGYEAYGAQGGDWGAIISRVLAANNGDRVIGLHLNFRNRRAAGRHGQPGRGCAGRGAGAAGGEGRELRERVGLFRHPGDEAPDGRLRSKRLAGRSSSLDRREVPRVERPRRRPGKCVHQG